MKSQKEIQKDIQLKCLKYGEKVQNCLLENDFNEHKCVVDIMIWRECLKFYSRKVKVEFPEVMRKSKEKYDDEVFDLNSFAIDEKMAAEIYNIRNS